MDLLIFGAGASGRETAWLAQCIAENERRDGLAEPLVLRAFVDDAKANQVINGVPVLSLSEASEGYPGAAFVVGIGSPFLRAEVVRGAEGAGFVPSQPLVAPNACHSRSVSFGEGSVICSGSIVTVNVAIGRHVQINVGCSVAHDAILGEYATLAPGVHVAGFVTIGSHAYIGTGANIINGTEKRRLVIGEGSTVGAGACVIADVAPSTTVVGVPAKPVSRRGVNRNG